LGKSERGDKAKSNRFRHEEVARAPCCPALRGVHVEGKPIGCHFPSPCSEGDSAMQLHDLSVRVVPSLQKPRVCALCSLGSVVAISTFQIWARLWGRAAERYDQPRSLQNVKNTVLLI